MAYQFDGTSDRSLYSTEDPGDFFNGGGSFAVWYEELGDGQANFPQMYAQGISTEQGFVIQHRAVSASPLRKHFALILPWSGTAQVDYADTRTDWETTSGWHLGVVTFDTSDSTNTPTFYMDGVLDTHTRVQGPGASETLGIVTGERYIGCNSGGTLREFDGNLAEISCWNTVLTAADVAALYAGVSALNIRPDSLVSHLPMVRGTQDVINGDTFTVNNSPTVSSHIPIIQPSAQIFHFPPGEAAPAANAALLTHPHRHTNLGFG